MIDSLDGQDGNAAEFFSYWYRSISQVVKIRLTLVGLMANRIAKSWFGLFIRSFVSVSRSSSSSDKVRHPEESVRRSAPRREFPLHRGINFEQSLKNVSSIVNGDSDALNYLMIIVAMGWLPEKF